MMLLHNGEPVAPSTRRKSRWVMPYRTRRTTLLTHVRKLAQSDTQRIIC